MFHDAPILKLEVLYKSSVGRKPAWSHLVGATKWRPNIPEIVQMSLKSSHIGDGDDGIEGSGFRI